MTAVADRQGEAEPRTEPQQRHIDHDIERLKITERTNVSSRREMSFRIEPDSGETKEGDNTSTWLTEDSLYPGK